MPFSGNLQHCFKQAQLGEGVLRVKIESWNNDNTNYRVRVIPSANERSARLDQLRALNDWRPGQQPEVVERPLTPVQGPAVYSGW